jgi:hypothetical protein
MFPWSPEFAWDASHLVFFGALYSVVAAIAAALALAGWRAWRDARAGRAPAVAWHADFEDLPASARACRHQLTGEAPGRVCENAFDCRQCAGHPVFEALRERRSAASGEDADAARAVSLGFDLPLDRFYHRGHTWVRLESDGTVTVGLDEMARRLVGLPEAVERPAAGTRLLLNGALARIRTGLGEVRVLSPIDGTVVATAGSGRELGVRLVPLAPLDARHLLWGREARLWALRELERLERTLGPVGQAPALADGGELVADIGAALPAEQYDALLGEMLLEP